MSCFTTSSATENFLTSIGVKFSYAEEMKYDELEPQWASYNHGRPEAQRRVEDAIVSYASMMDQGSLAPAIIVRRRGNGYQILDGFQRVSGNQLLGHTTFAAYIVDCQDKMANKIRLVANTRINGAAPVDSDWTLERAVQLFMIEDTDSAEDISRLVGKRRSDVEKMYRYLTAKAGITAACHAEGKEPPSHFGKAVYEAIATASDPSDFEPGPRSVVVDFLSTVDACEFPNGEAVRLANTFFGIKRIGSKNRTTQFRSQLRTIRGDAHVRLKLDGKATKHDDISKIVMAYKGLQTRVKAYKKKKTASLHDVDTVKALDEMDAEIGRMLRELCTTEVRSKLDPFNR